MRSIHTTTVVACRILGLYIALRWLGLLPVVVSPLFAGPSFIWSSFGAITIFAIPLVLAMFLWKLAPWIATRMLVDTERTPEASVAVALEDAHSAAISVLGLLFVCEALPGVVVSLLGYLQVSGIATDMGIQSQSNANSIKAIVMHLIKIGVGAWLFVGSHSFARLAQKCGDGKRDGKG